MNTESVTPPKRQEIWPWAIVIAFVIFGSSMLYAVMYNMRQKVDLVSPEYYQEELAYQDRINREIMTRTLHKEVVAKAIPGKTGIELQFPLDTLSSTAVKGTVQLYRPSDASQDQSFDASPDAAGVQHLDAGVLRSGHWRVRVKWDEGALGFYSDVSLEIQP